MSAQAASPTIGKQGGPVMVENEQTQQPVLVIMGVSGSGKSTVAGILAGQLGWDLEEGDDDGRLGQLAAKLESKAFHRAEMLSNRLRKE